MSEPALPVFHDHIQEKRLVNRLLSSLCVGVHFGAVQSRRQNLASKKMLGSLDALVHAIATVKVEHTLPLKILTFGQGDGSVDNSTLQPSLLA